VPPDLRDPDGAENPDHERSADRGEQQGHAEREVATGVEVADLDALGVLEDEDQQKREDDCPGGQPAEGDGRSRSRWPRPGVAAGSANGGLTSRLALDVGLAGGLLSLRRWLLGCHLLAPASPVERVIDPCDEIDAADSNEIDAADPRHAPSPEAVGPTITLPLVILARAADGA
jgi:hypothetical protein